MKTVIYWFRNDLRLEDNPAFLQACNEADHILPIYIHQAHLEREISWGFPRADKHRQSFLEQSLHDLRAQLHNKGSDLLEFKADSVDVFKKLRTQMDIDVIYCEQIEAPEELEQVLLLRDAGFQVNSIWQSSMLDPQSLPFLPEGMPDIFTQFRQQVEKHKLRFAMPVDAPQ